jgi:hypothetical protein
MTRDPCIGVSQVIKRYAVVVVSVQYYPTYNNFLRDSRICLPKGGHMTPVFLVSRFFCCSQWSNVQAICLCSISLDKVHCFKKKKKDGLCPLILLYKSTMQKSSPILHAFGLNLFQIKCFYTYGQVLFSLEEMIQNVFKAPMGLLFGTSPIRFHLAEPKELVSSAVVFLERVVLAF